MEYANQNFPRRLTRRRSGPMAWLSLAGAVGIWIGPFLGLTFVLALLAWVFLVPGFLGAFVTPLLAGLFVYALYRIVMDARRRNGRIILGYLDMAVRLNLPLVPFLHAAALSETGRRSRQLTTICRSLAAGAPVWASLVDATDVPNEVVTRLEAAEPLGQLREALARSRVEEQTEADESAATPDAMLFRFYPIMMFFAIWTLLTFTMIFVVPKFQEIFKDFRTTLPPLTQFVMGISGWLDDYWPVTVLVVLGLLAGALLLVSVMLSRVFLPFYPIPDFRRIGQWLAWRLPVLHTLERDRGMAELCGLLAGAQRGGVPLPVALQRAQRLPVNEGFCRQIMRFQDQLLAGQVPAEAAAAARLPHLLTGMLAAAPDRAPEAGLFAFLARYYRNRFSRTVLLIRGAAEPLMVLTFATIVGTTVLALFLPLVKLIQSVSGGAEGGGL